MQFFKKYNQYFGINEDIDISNFYKSQNIPAAVQKFAEERINNRLSGDYMYKKMWHNKIILWFARAIKKELIQLVYDNKIAFLFVLKNISPDNSTKWVTEYFKGASTSELITKYSLNKSVDDIEKIMFDTVKESSKIDVKLPGIIDFILSPVRQPDQKPNWNGSFEEVDRYQDEWHKNLKMNISITDEDGIVLKKYPDGYYWIDLKTNESKQEALAMGHCGRTSADTLWSLRDAKKVPHLTVAISEETEGRIEGYDDENIIRQLKGKQNAKPVAKYHPYIVDMIVDKKTFKIAGQENEYAPELDFQFTDLNPDQMIEVFTANPDYVKNTKENEYIPFFTFPEKFIKNLESDFCEDYILKDKHIRFDALSFKAFVDIGIFDEEKADDILKELRIKNVKLVDGKFIYTVDNLSDFEQFFDSNSVGLFETYVVNGEHFESDDYEDISTIMRSYKLDPEVVKIIIEAINKKGFDIPETSTTDDIADLFDENSDELDEVIDAIRFGYTEAQNTANTDELYQTVWNKLEKYFQQEIIASNQGYSFEIKKDWIQTCYDDGKKDGFLDQLYGSKDLIDYVINLKDSHEAFEPIKIRESNYGWHGTVTKQMLLDGISYRLDEIQ